MDRKFTRCIQPAKCIFSFKGYFGGTVECNEQAEGEDKYDPKDLVCGGCSNKERDQVSIKDPR